jgi:LacI family transcriptional regulator
VSVIGFDYIHSRLELPFQLTSISSHKRHMSTTAVDVLLGAIQAPDAEAYEQIVIDTTLSEGQTVLDRV